MSVRWSWKKNAKHGEMTMRVGCVRLDLVGCWVVLGRDVLDYFKTKLKRASLKGDSTLGVQAGSWVR